MSIEDFTVWSNILISCIHSEMYAWVMFTSLLFHCEGQQFLFIFRKLLITGNIPDNSFTLDPAPLYYRMVYNYFPSTDHSFRSRVDQCHKVGTVAVDPSIFLLYK